MGMCACAHVCVCVCACVCAVVGRFISNERKSGGKRKRMLDGRTEEILGDRMKERKKRNDVPDIDNFPSGLRETLQHSPCM